MIQLILNKNVQPFYSKKKVLNLIMFMHLFIYSLFYFIYLFFMFYEDDFST